MKKSNEELRRAFDKVISTERLVQEKDKELFYRNIEKGKVKRRKSYLIPNLLTALFIFGVIGVLYGLFFSDLKKPILLAGNYESIEDLSSDSSLIIKGEVLEGSLERETRYDSEVIKELHYKVRVNEIIKNTTGKVIQVEDVIQTYVVTEIVNGLKTKVDSAIKPGNYLLFLDFLEQDRLNSMFVKIPTYLYEVEDEAYKNIQGSELRNITEADLNTIKNNYSNPKFADILDSNDKYQKIYEQLNHYFINYLEIDGYHAKLYSEAATLYLYGVFTGNVELAKKYVATTDGELDYTRKRNLENNMLFYRNLQDYEIKIKEIEQNHPSLEIPIWLDFGNEEETRYRILILETIFVYDGRVGIYDSSTTKSYHVIALPDINKEYVAEVAKVGLAKDEVQELFGQPDNWGTSDGVNILLYDRINNSLYDMSLEAVAHEEILSGNVEYQLFVLFKDGEAFIYNYFYLGEDGKVWEYSLLPDGSVYETPSYMKDTLLEKSELIFTSLKDHDWNEIAKMTYPDGLIFSHFADLGSPYSEVSLSKEELIKDIQEEIVWVEGEGEIKKTLNGYVDDVLFKIYGNDLNYDTVSFNSSSVENYGGTINTIPEYFPEAKYVEYYSKYTDENKIDWQALRFVFKEHDGEWLLFAIVRDVFSP